MIPGRLLFIRVQFENFKAVFVNVYAPTSGSEKVLFLKDVNVKLQNCSSDEVLFLGGDFNCTENYRLDRNHLEPHAPSSLQVQVQVELYCHSAACGDIQWNEMSCLTGPRCYINTDIQHYKPIHKLTY